MLTFLLLSLMALFALSIVVAVLVCGAPVLLIGIDIAICVMILWLLFKLLFGRKKK